MDDIVIRLRKIQKVDFKDVPGQGGMERCMVTYPYPECQEAADEIERLRHDLERAMANHNADLNSHDFVWLNLRQKEYDKRMAEKGAAPDNPQGSGMFATHAAVVMEIDKLPKEQGGRR